MKVLVCIEERAGGIRKPSLEAITAAQSLGASEIIGCAIGSELNPKVLNLPVATLAVVKDPKLEKYSSHAYAKAIAEAAKATDADVVIIPATGRGKDLAPRVAVM